KFKKIVCPWFPRSIGAGGTTKLKCNPLKPSFKGFFIFITCIFYTSYILKALINTTLGKLKILKIGLNSIMNIFKTNFTKAASDWELVLSFQCNTKEDAVFLKRFIKKMKSRTFIEKVIQNPEILNQILKK